MDMTSYWADKFVKKIAEKKMEPEYETFFLVEISGNKFVTWEIICNNMDINWYWPTVSLNPNITWEIVKANPSIKWCFKALSMNPNITWEIIRDNPGYPWDMLYISRNINITDEIVIKNLDLDWCYHSLTGNPGITLDLIKKFPEKPWSWFYISQRKDLTTEFVNNNFRNLISFLKDYDVSYQIVMDVIKIKPKYYCRVFSSCIKWDFIEKHPTLPWDWEEVSLNPNITWEIVKNNPEMPWKIKNIVKVLPITQEIIDRCKDEDLVCWYHLSCKVTPKLLLSNLDKKWRWTKIVTSNPNITYKFLSSHPSLPWDETLALSNPYFCYDDYISLCQKKKKIITLPGALYSPLKYHNIVFQMYINDQSEIYNAQAVFSSFNKFCDQLVKKEKAAAIKIQRSYLRCKLDPRYKLCRKSLSDDYFYMSMGATGEYPDKNIQIGAYTIL
jgi:hypothetical protein